MRWLCIVVVSLLIAACAPMQWMKADANPTEADADLKTCQDEAWREANWRSTYYFGAIGPMLYQDQLGRRLLAWPYGPFSDPFGDRFLEESRLANFCMRSKGYELAPLNK
jgi:hypothetical protein